MPIFGRKPEECFNEFRDHLAKLLAAIISDSHVFNYVGSGNRRSLGFLRGNLTTVPVQMSHGILHLYLDQTLEAE